MKLVTRFFSIATLVLASFFFAQNAVAYTVYEHLPDVQRPNLTNLSLHGASGPVLADDFIPTRAEAAATVLKIEWWGSAPKATVANTPDSFEITFHTDAGGVPAIGPVDGGISQHFVTSFGTQIGTSGVFHYEALWTPQDLQLKPGAHYWFSVANVLPEWAWATTVPGSSPTVGGQSYAPQVSVNGSPSSIPGPHDGPWNPVQVPEGVNFAFRITAVPEPSTYLLFGAGLLGLLALRRKARL